MRRDSRGPNPRPTILTAKEEGGRGSVMQHSDPKVLEKHIKAVTRGTSFQERVFHGIQALEEAATRDEPLLRRGQLIFGTVSIAHDRDMEDMDGTRTRLGTIANWLAPVLTKVKTGQARQYAYLHVAVYAGQYKGEHYVIENGGQYDRGFG